MINQDTLLNNPLSVQISNFVDDLAEVIKSFPELAERETDDDGCQLDGINFNGSCTRSELKKVNCDSEIHEYQTDTSLVEEK